MAVKLELISEPLIAIGIGGGKEAVKALIDEPQGYTKPLQNVADHVAGTVPFALGIVDMFTWKTRYGAVAMGAGGAFLGEAIAKHVREWTGTMRKSEGGLKLELETPQTLPGMSRPSPQVSQVDRIHGVIV